MEEYFNIKHQEYTDLGEQRRVHKITYLDNKKFENGGYIAEDHGLSGFLAVT